MAFAGGLFALNQNRVVELAAAFCYAGSAIGVAFAGDLLTRLHLLGADGDRLDARGLERGPVGTRRRTALRRDPSARRRSADGRHRRRDRRTPARSASARWRSTRVPRWLILAGFLVNAGAPPLSAWLPDAYPESSWSGMVFLSAFTTKTAVYVLLRGFPGTELLIYVGLFMVFYGIVYAILENDMRRILAYSIVNQVGFMVAASASAPRWRSTAPPRTPSPTSSTRRCC